jgi:glyoxylase-like metal-dependent hydrolase (beta-lactamase superfamily II)
VSDNTTSYEVHGLRYGSRPGNKATEFYGFHRYGELDEPCSMDYFVWLVRNNDRTVLVDCGYNRDRARENGRYTKNTLSNDVLDVLARMDVSAADVDHVVLSHMHRDHVGNASRFPNATFSMALEEFDFWTGPRSNRVIFSDTVEPEEVAAVEQLLHEERLLLVDQTAELLPGINAARLAGHTPGQMMTEVATATGSIVLASDAIHYWEEMERDRPFWFFVDLEGMYRSYDVLRELDSRPGTTVIPGHDPLVMSRFKHVGEDVVDLTVPVESE